MATFVGVVAGSLYGTLKSATYESSSTLYIASQVGDSAEALYQGSLLTQQRVSSYTDLVTSDRVVSDVRNRLRLQEPVDELAKRITATNAPASVLINITASGPDPASATLLTRTVDDVFVDLINEIERPGQRGASQPVELRLVQPATEPTEPSSLSFFAVASIGLIAGLLVGVASVVLIELLDRTIKDSQDLDEISSHAVLAQVPEHAKPGVLLGQNDNPVEWSESFRQLRTNLQYLDVDVARRVLCVTSAIEAEGKTSVAANLAIVSSLAGIRTILLDGDLRRPAIAELMNVEPAVGLSSVLSGRTTLGQATQRWSSNLDIIASGPRPPNPAEMLGSNQMQSLVKDLRDRYDLVLIDTPPVLPVTDATALTPTVDGVVLVVRATHTTTTQVSAALRSLDQVSAPISGLILNRATKTELKAYGKYGSYTQASIQYGEEDAPTITSSSAHKQEARFAEADGRPTPRPRFR